MYPVSEAFLQAVQENTRNYFWDGLITTRQGVEYPFDEEMIVKGSGSIKQQCCGSTEIEIGSVYAAELDISLFMEADRYSLEDATVELWFSLKLANGNYERIPMGVFEVSEANQSIHILELKAFDYMIRFEKDFSNFETIGDCYDFMELCSLACDVELEQTREEIETLQNASLNLSIYKENDIETYRDVLYYIGQILGGFFYINRSGKLELKRFGASAVYEIDQEHRYSSSVSDYRTRYTAVSSTNSVTQIAEYYHVDPDDGLTMNLGINPLLQYGLDETRETICTNILNVITDIDYYPFEIEATGNPALDIGDVISLSGGQMQAGAMACITSRTLRIGGKEKISGVGKNPKLAAAKSKNNKNLTGIMNKIDASVMQMVLFTNARVLALIDSRRVLAEQITFAVKNNATVEFQGQIVVDVTTESSLVCEVTFQIDGTDITLHKPIESWSSGSHILSLYYPVDNMVPDIVHDFRVYLTVSGGSGEVNIGGAIGCIRGFGLAAAEIEWDGTIVVEDMIAAQRLDYGFGMPVIGDGLVVNQQIPTPITYSETLPVIAIQEGSFVTLD